MPCESLETTKRVEYKDVRKRRKTEKQTAEKAKTITHPDETNTAHNENHAREHGRQQSVSVEAHPRLRHEIFDKHGYAEPDQAGGGKNKVDYRKYHEADRTLFHIPPL